MSRRALIAIYLALGALMGAGVAVIGFDPSAGVPLFAWLGISAAANMLLRRRAMSWSRGWDRVAIAWFVVTSVTYAALSLLIRGHVR